MRLFCSIVEAETRKWPLRCLISAGDVTNRFSDYDFKAEVIK